MKYNFQGDDSMIWSIVFFLLVIWIIFVIAGHLLGGLIHILLLIAVVIVLIRVIKGKKVI